MKSKMNNANVNQRTRRTQLGASILASALVAYPRIHHIVFNSTVASMVGTGTLVYESDLTAIVRPP